MPIEKIDETQCTGCKICIDSCSLDVIYFDEETKKAYIRYPKDCVSCFSCESDCPVNAIFVTPRRGVEVPHPW